MRGGVFVEEKFVVIYRANENLSALVPKLNTIFVKEFSSQISVEDISEDLLFLPTEIWQKRPDENRQNQNTISILIDGTVWAAMKFAERGGATVPWNSEFNHDDKLRDLYFIKQDDVNGYDLYADHIAAVARNASKVILVRDCIADHNSEGLENPLDESKVARKPLRIHWVVSKWIERLQARGVRPIVFNRLSGYDTTGEYSLADEVSVADLMGAVLICDGHHLNKCPSELWESYGLLKIFRACPPFNYKSNLIGDYIKKIT